MSALCSNCREPIGQWKGSASPAAFNCVYDEPCNPCITVAEWDAKISEIEELLEKLKKQRNIARTEMNRVHDPLIQQVPPEIASHIFTLHIYNDHTDMAEYPRPLVLASVCKKWREIAFSTPQIWTTLVVYDCDEWKFPAHLAEQWLARSGQLPLNIKILWEDPPEEPDVSAMKTLIGAICSYSNRWNILDLDIPPEAFVFFKANTLVHSHLEHLEIDCERSEFTPEMPFDPTNIIIHPKKLELSFTPSSLVLVDWKTIVDLSLNRNTLTQILYALQQCPQIERLFASSIGGWDESTTLTTPLILHNLKFLRGWSNSTAIFLNLLTLPALYSLDWTYNFERADMMSLISMVKRSACLLAELRLSWTQRGLLDEDDMTNLLFDLPSLRALELVFPKSFKDSTFFEHFLTGLASSSGSSTTRGLSRPFLPRLESFTYEGPTCFSWYTLATVYYNHSRSLPAAQSDQDVQQPPRQLLPRPLKSLNITTPNSEKTEDFIGRESLLLFLDLPENSMEVNLDAKLMGKSIEYHGLAVDEDVSSFYSLTV